MLFWMGSLNAKGTGELKGRDDLKRNGTRWRSNYNKTNMHA